MNTSEIDTPPSPSWLSDIMEAARQGASAEANLQLGPVPLLMGVEQPDWLDDYRDSLSTSSAPNWKPLEVRSVTAATVSLGGLPKPLRPVGADIRRAVVGRTIIFASGLEGCTWILDAEQGLAVRWTERHNDVPLWDRVSLRVATNWWAAENGAALVHAGAVAGPDGAVLLTGDSGAGKSTTTMACIDQGLDVLGDDFCLVEPPSGGEAPLVHATYRIAKLDERSLDLLPHLRERAIGHGVNGKTLLHLDNPPTNLLPIRAICHVVQDPAQPTHLVPISRARGMQAVAPSTLFQLRIAERTTWDVLARTTAAVPSYTLSVSKLSEVPDAVRSALH